MMHYLLCSCLYMTFWAKGILPNTEYLEHESVNDHAWSIRDWPAVVISAQLLDLT